MKHLKTIPKKAELAIPPDDVSYVYAWKQQGVFDGAPAGLIQVDVKGR